MADNTGAWWFVVGVFGFFIYVVFSFWFVDWLAERRNSKPKNEE
jgi:hypothetical protein